MKACGWRSATGIDRANELMKEAGVNWFIAGPIVRSCMDIFIKQKLNEVLEL